MGGGILRTHRSNNNDTGLTHFDYPVPTLTICGTKDGLYRVTRAAEGYFHQFLNIEKSEAGKYPIHIVQGGTHGSFMDDTMLPTLVRERDLKPTNPQSQDHKEIAGKIVDFISHTRGDEKVIFNAEGDAADKFMAPIIESMHLEGSYHIRPACYNISTINPDWPTKCMKGNLWTSQAQHFMGGDLGGV